MKLLTIFVMFCIAYLIFSVFSCTIEQPLTASNIESVESVESDSLNNTIDSLNNTIDSLNNTIDSLNNTIDSLNNTIDSLKTTINSLNVVFGEPSHPLDIGISDTADSLESNDLIYNNDSNVYINLDSKLSETK